MYAQFGFGAAGRDYKAGLLICVLYCKTYILNGSVTAS